MRFNLFSNVFSNCCYLNLIHVPPSCIFIIHCGFEEIGTSTVEDLSLPSRKDCQIMFKSVVDWLRKDIKTNH